MADRYTPGTGDLILRCFGVARGLEDEGQNNIAKMFRAAAFREIYRETRNRPRLGNDLEREMRDVINALLDRPGTAAALREALPVGLRAIENGEWPLLSDLPRTNVCHFCGEVMLGEPPDQCPVCRARPLTFQEILPVFYLEPLEIDEVNAALESNLRDVVERVDGVSEQDADQGVWPMRDILSHLSAAQNLMLGRAKRMLTEDNPNLGSVPPTAIRSDASTMADLLEEFRSTRREAIDFASHLSAADFSRPGFHPEWGPLTILSQLTYMVRHEQSHLHELQERSEGR